MTIWKILSRSRCPPELKAILANLSQTEGISTEGLVQAAVQDYLLALIYFTHQNRPHPRPLAHFGRGEKDLISSPAPALGAGVRLRRERSAERDEGSYFGVSGMLMPIYSSISGKAVCIVTGDQDLLTLKKFGDIAILAPAEFKAYEEQVDTDQD